MLCSQRSPQFSLKSILSNNLRDLEDFYTAVLLHFKIAIQQDDKSVV